MLVNIFNYILIIINTYKASQIVIYIHSRVPPRLFILAETPLVQNNEYY